ncbi:hypothetical protein LOTGIDRAFT_163097 [Lottia gigantea]|uniref:Uncharacterized protein n=1 Tax=Lottia gigantea TaxID=225164 RepID=V3ZK99_LOTGI|nr:hypothetical protein LOTGIDRAFT_163097 [Lottia gigantea]ESO91738.1 hypothetical protein LOTGIDRAFT_163097 [Lottia gigantea]
MLQSAAAGANTPPASSSSSKLSHSSSSKPEKKTKNVSDVSGEMTSVELPQVDMELEDMAADTERLNSVLGSLTPGGSSNGEGVVSEREFSDEDDFNFVENNILDKTGGGGDGGCKATFWFENSKRKS